MTKLTTPPEFDALLMKLQRALRGADDLDAASALIALLFHRLTLLDGEPRTVARQAVRDLLKVGTGHGKDIALVERPRRLLRVMH